MDVLCYNCLVKPFKCVAANGKLSQEKNKQLNVCGMELTSGNEWISKFFSLLLQFCGHGGSRVPFFNFIFMKLSLF